MADFELAPGEAASIALNSYFALKDWAIKKPVAGTESRGKLKDMVLGSGNTNGVFPKSSSVGASFPGNFYECTVGLNYKPSANLTIRPEMRWDWYDGQPNQNPLVPVTAPYAAGSRTNQFTYGLDLTYQW